MCLSFAHGQELSAQDKFNALQAAGIFEAAGNGSADLDQAMNRAQFARVAALIMGLDPQDKPPAGTAFTDVSTSELTAGYMVGIVGEADATFSPDQASNVSLEQLAKVLVTALGLEVNTDAQVGGASGWAQGYVAAAVAAGLIPPSVDYTQLAIRQDLVGAAFAASASILGEETLDQGMVDPDDVNPQNEVTSQDLVSMLTPNTEQADTQGGQSAIVPGKDEPYGVTDNLVPGDQIANEVLIDKLVLQSVALAAADSPNAPDVPGVPSAPGTPDAGAMYPYFDAGFITPDLSVLGNLNATYIGRADGAFIDGAVVGGALTMNVDFANSASSGGMDARILFDNAMGYVDFALFQNVGDILKTGTVTGDYGPSNNMDPIVDGDLAGKFYGPNAEEVGGSWEFNTDSGRPANGSFNGKR